MTTIEEELSEFLEHAGVKGMRWGVRNSDSTSTPAPMSTRKKVLIGSTIAATVATATLGSILVARTMNKKPVPMSVVKNATQGAKVAEDLIKKTANVQLTGKPLYATSKLSTGDFASLKKTLDSGNSKAVLDWIKKQEGIKTSQLGFG